MSNDNPSLSFDAKRADEFFNKNCIYAGKMGGIMAEDPNTPICRAQVVGEAGAVLERLRLALEAVLDQTIVEPSDTRADLQTRLETINKIVRQAVDLSA